MRSIVVLALFAAVAVPLSAPSPAPARKPFYGVSPQAGQLQERDFNRMRRARIGTIRIGANRDRTETPDGTFNWAHLDRTVGLAASRGIRALPVIGQEGGPRTLRERRALRRFAAALARRYAPRGEFWRGDYGR